MIVSVLYLFSFLTVDLSINEYNEQTFICAMIKGSDVVTGITIVNLTDSNNIYNDPYLADIPDNFARMNSSHGVFIYNTKSGVSVEARSYSKIQLKTH